MNCTTTPTLHRGSSPARAGAVQPRRHVLPVCVIALALLALVACSDTLLREHIITQGILSRTENVIYVSPDGNDGNYGTQDAPKRTINAAIRVFSENRLTGEVVVAGGTYEVDFYEDTHVMIQEGVSLYGGLSPDFQEVDREAHPSIIQDVSSGPTEDEVHPRAVEAPAGVTRATVFEGFTVIGGTGQSALGVLVNGGSPLIRHCVIKGGSPTVAGDNWTWACGLRLAGGEPLVQECDISGSQIADVQLSSGIAADGGATFDVEACVVSSGPAFDSTEAISIGGESDGTVSTSTITAEEAAEAKAIRVTGSHLNLWECTVRAGGDSSEISEGVRLDGSSANMATNDIRAYYGSTHSMGIHSLNESRPGIWESFIAAGGGNYSAGISLDGTNAGRIEAGFNVVFGGTGTWAEGIYAKNMEGIIYTSLIHGGGADAAGSRGVRLDGGTPSIENNTIYGGSASTTLPDGTTPSSFGISCEPSQPEIMSNVIFTGGAGAQVGIFNANGLASSAAYNLFYNSSGTMALYDYDTGAYVESELTTLEADLTNFHHNVTGDPAFADDDGADDDIDTMDDNDWHLTAATPASITEGGWMSGDDYLDLDGTRRTAPWSIGAYEYD